MRKQSGGRIQGQVGGRTGRDSNFKLSDEKTEEICVFNYIKGCNKQN